MHLLAHHMGEDSLINWLVLCGSLLPLMLAAARNRVAAICRRLTRLLRPRSRKA